MKVLFCGDIMPGGVLPYQERYIDSDLKEYMEGFDLRIGTLECAIGTNLSPAPEKLKENGGNNNVCFARDEDFFRVVEMGIDIVSLGNNHSFDLGKTGLYNIMRLCDKNSIRYFGAGFNKKEASAPLIIQKEGITIGFIGCCIKGLTPTSLIVATENSYGVYQPDIIELEKQISTLRKRVDILFVLPHWGEEHILFPPYKCVEYAKKMIDAGADAVFGSHSHRVSTNITYKGKPIYFGLGNYLYPDNCLTPPRPFYYPESVDELRIMKHCVNYPRSVSQNTLLVWSEDSRIGIAAETSIQKKGISVKRQLVRMDNNNVLQFYNKYSVLKNLIMNYLIIPICNLISNPVIYKSVYRIVGHVERKKLKYLGDFRKDI